jgi:hypothetical protein
VCQCVFFGGVHGHVIVAAHPGVDELDDDFFTDILEMMIASALKGES